MKGKATFCQVTVRIYTADFHRSLPILHPRRSRGGLISRSETK